MCERQKQIRELREIALDLAIRLKEFEESLNSEDEKNPCDDCLLTYDKSHEICKECDRYKKNKNV